MNWRLRLLCCVLAFMLLACNGTATPLLTPTMIVTTAPSSTPTTSNTGCIPWSELTAGHKDKNICVLGDVVEIENAKGVGFYFIRFANSTTPFFYIMQNTQPAVQVGNCINVTGTLMFDNNGVPFMNGNESEIKICNAEP